MAKGKLLDENQPDSGTYILTDNVTATNFLANIPHSKGSDIKQLRNLRSRSTPAVYNRKILHTENPPIPDPVGKLMNYSNKRYVDYYKSELESQKKHFSALQQSQSNLQSDQEATWSRHSRHGLVNSSGS